MLVQSGKPVGVFRTHEWAPRVLIANSNLVGEWATWDEFRRLEALGLTMYGQMTAGSWIYIGSQGIVQGTYECFAEIARRRFGGSLAGTITLTAGLGGMGGAQPLAVTMNEGVVLCVEVDRDRIRRRHRDALPRRGGGRPRRRRRALPAREARAARAQRRPVRERRRGASRAAPPGLRGRRRDRPDERPRPARGLRARRAHARRGRDAAARGPRGVHPPRAPVGGRALLRDGRLHGRRRGGVRLRQQPARRGEARRLRARLRLPGLRARPTSARCSARARGRSAGWRCRATPRTSPPPTARSSRSSRRTRASRAGSAWRGERIAFQGLPARICWLGYGERRRLGLRFNEMVKSGELQRADRDRARPPRLGLGGLALPRDRVDARRLRRDRRLAAPERAREHRRRRRPG